MADVILARWPEERDDAARLAAAGSAVLYLVSTDSEPPPLTSCTEDWFRVPGDDRDLEARIALLRLRADLHGALPTIDGDIVHYRGQTIAIAPEEAELARTLVSRFGQAVDDADFDVHDPSLRTRMGRLRRQLRTIGLTLRRIPGRGYRLTER